MYNEILKLRAKRSFTDRAISTADMEKVLEAARWTGSSKNRQNWSFLVVDDPAQKQRLLESGSFMTPVANAPAAICLVQEPEGYEFDTGRLAQNIMLAADALGLSTCPVTLHNEAVAAEVLELPSDRRCRYAIAIGYPGEDAEPPKPAGGRKPMDELVHWNRYDA